MEKNIREGKKDVMVNLKDLFAEIVRKGWLLLIGMVVFAILLAGIKYQKDAETAKLTTPIAVQEELTEEEEAAVNEYLVLKESLDGQEEYIENSLYMQLDPYDFVVTNFQFYIETEDESDLTSAVLGLRNYIVNGSLAAGIEDDNEELSSAYVQDIFYIYAMDYSSQNVSKIVNLKFYTPDHKTAQAIADGVYAQIDKFSASLQQTIGNHEISIMYQSQGDFLDKAIQTGQENYTKNYDSNRSRVESAYDALSETQKAAADEMMAEKESDKAADEAGVEKEELENQEEEQTVEPAKVRISKKFLVLGAVVGIFLMACLVVFLYLMNGTIKMPEEIRNGYGISYFGSVSFKKKNIFEKLADKLFYRDQQKSVEEAKELILSKVHVACENQNISRFVLAGQVLDDGVKEFVSELTEELKKNQIEVIVADDMVNSSDAIRMCGKDTYVVLLETLKRTRYSQLRQEVMLCEEQKKEIIGYITVCI